MENKLREHMDYLFREVPVTKKSVELKEEILQNLIDKYHDLIAEGKSEEAAYNIAVASIGDISELLEPLKEGGQPANPVISEEYRRWKKRSSILIPVAVMLYILSVVPPIICDAFGGNDAAGASGLFLFVGIATAIIIFNHMSKPIADKVDDTMMDEFKEWKSNRDQRKHARRAINSALWSIIVVLYFLISFSTGAWYITWVIFLIGGAAESIITAIFALTE